jgi:Tfp pilus assembly PilM family ATPase/Tfp pilus assembly protein PilN
VENGERGLALLSTQTLRPTDDLARALKQLPRRPAAVTSAVTLEHAAVRTLSLPATAEENLERVITLEAETVLPLPAEELALSHHVLGMTEQSRLEVLVAAARQSVVQDVLARVNCAPWVAATVTVTPVALFNAVHQVQPLGKETVAVLRVEERGSELVLMDRTRILMAQSLPIGCGAVAALAPHAVPVGAGVQEEGGVGVLSPDEHPWITPLSQQVRYALQALSYERGLSIERLYVCGKGAGRAGAEWHLGERLGLPVHPLAPAEAGANGGVFAVAFGCAVQAAGAAPVALNLTPARVAVAREIEARRQTQFSWGALAGSAVLAAALVFGAAVYSKKQQLAQINERSKGLEGVVPPQASVPPAKLDAAIKAIDQVATVRVPAAKALSTLSRHLPEGTWLAELAYNAQTGSVVRGYSTDPSGAQRAQVALLRQRLFDEVTLDYLAEERIGNVPVWSFQLNCRLRPEDPRARARGARR